MSEFSCKWVEWYTQERGLMRCPWGSQRTAEVETVSAGQES